MSKHQFQHAGWQGGDGYQITKLFFFFLFDLAISLEIFLHCFWSLLFSHRNYFHSQQCDSNQDWYMYHCVCSLLSVNEPSSCWPWGKKKSSSSERCSGKKKVSVIFYRRKYRSMFVDREGMGKVMEIIFALWYCCGFWATCIYVQNQQFLLRKSEKK